MQLGKHIFLSYSRQDADFALKLAQDLRAGGVDVWLDQIDIPPGARWDRAVDTALKTCASLMIILSPHSAGSENVLDEVAVAMRENKAVIPVLHRPCEIPLRLTRLQYIDFVHGYDEGLQDLMLFLNRAKETQDIHAETFAKTGASQLWDKNKGGGASMTIHGASPQEVEASTKNVNSKRQIAVYVVSALGLVSLTIAATLMFVSQATTISPQVAVEGNPVAKSSVPSLGQSGPSTNRDQPTRISSNEVRGTGLDSQRVRYYYSFVGGPGEVKVTFDFTSGGTAQGGTVTLFDEDARKLETIFIVGHKGDTGREVKRIQLSQARVLIVEIDLESGASAGGYLLRVEGAVQFR